MNFYSSAPDPCVPTRGAVIERCIGMIRELDPDFEPRWNVSAGASAPLESEAGVVANAPLSVEADAIAAKLADALYRLEWLRLSDEGAWMLRVFDGSGACVEISAADDPQDALLAVADQLLP